MTANVRGAPQPQEMVQVGMLKPSTPPSLAHWAKLNPESLT